MSMEQARKTDVAKFLDAWGEERPRLRLDDSAKKGRRGSGELCQSGAPNLDVPEERTAKSTMHRRKGSLEELPTDADAGPFVLGEGRSSVP